MKLVLAGGSGALGRRIAADAVARGDEVVVLTRSRRTDLPHRQVEWDGRTVGPWAEELSGAVVVNLAGELVDRRPTAANVELLRRSRVEPTRALVEASRAVDLPPAFWLQMSTLAIYGDAGQGVVEEGHPLADGPPQMAGVARAWEEALDGVRAGRTVLLRTGIVLDPGTPAFERLRSVTRWGLGGRIGSGRQWVSWIHVADLLAALRFLIEHDDVAGPVHVTAPEPVRNAALMRSLRTALHRPWAPPTPTLMVRVGALAMRTDPALALTGRRCVPMQLLEAGFDFAHPRLDDALRDLLAH